LLTLQWLTAGTAILVACAALVRARRVAKRLDRLSESYWELRYEYGQLRSQLTRLESPGSDAEAGPDPQRQQGGGSTVFVPLSSLKR
jgi:hypothetical protein